MNQDERYMAVIAGIVSDAAKLVSVWEALRKLFSGYADEIIEAFDRFNEAACLSAMGLEDLFKQVDENTIDLTGTSPKEYGMSLQKHHCKTTMRYNYIPRTPRNLPYQRRAY